MVFKGPAEGAQEHVGALALARPIASPTPVVEAPVEADKHFADYLANNSTKAAAVVSPANEKQNLEKM